MVAYFKVRSHYSPETEETLLHTTALDMADNTTGCLKLQVNLQTRLIIQQGASKTTFTQIASSRLFVVTNVTWTAVLRPRAGPGIQTLA